MTKTYYTTYKTAVHWLHNNYILCNDIEKIDNSIFDNMEFDFYDEENDTYMDIYQYYLTDASLSEIKFLQDTFGLLFTYSEMLDLFVLCVDHFGTGWDCVNCEVLSEEWARINKKFLV